MKDCILVHLDNNFDKFNLLMLGTCSCFLCDDFVTSNLKLFLMDKKYFCWRIYVLFSHILGFGWLLLSSLFSFMLQKLFSLIDQTSVPDNPDSLQNHEVLLPGHLITLYLKVESFSVFSILYLWLSINSVEIESMSSSLWIWLHFNHNSMNRMLLMAYAYTLYLVPFGIWKLDVNSSLEWNWAIKF